MKHILFVCTGNSCRSVMAEGFFRHLTVERALDIKTSSAGVSAVDGYPPTAETVQTMSEEGIDVSGHRSRKLTLEMVTQADKIFAMERTHKQIILENWPQAREKVFLMTQFASPVRTHGSQVDIPDPIHMPVYFYQNVAQVIRECVERITEGI